MESVAIATTSRSLPIRFPSAAPRRRRVAAAAAAKRACSRPTSLSSHRCALALELLTSPFVCRARRRGGRRGGERVQDVLRRRRRGRRAPRARRPRAVRALRLALLQGRGDGAGDERGDGERLDDGVGDGGPADGGRRGPARGVDAAMVALHQVPAAPDAGGLHLQRVRAAHHPRHQPARLHRRHRLRSVLRLQHFPQTGGQPEPVPRDEVLRRPGLPLRGGCAVQLPRRRRGRRQHLSSPLICVPVHDGALISRQRS